MSCLYICEIRSGLDVPDLGPALRKHILDKRDSAALNASLSAWNLLCDVLGSVHEDILFDGNGRPYLPGGPHFSLSHSASLAAVLVSQAPCGVDIERIDDCIAKRLASRCLHPNERDRDFFECWTKKECLVKRDGLGLFAHPERIDTTAYGELFFTGRVCDSDGQVYALSAICEDETQIKQVLRR